MLDVREHKRVLSGLRETKARQLGRHRAELEEEREAWRRAKEARPALHRTVLDGERAEMRRSRALHRTMLAQNRWLLTLADRLQERLRKAG